MVFIGVIMRVICEVDTYRDYMELAKGNKIVRLTNGRNNGIVNIECDDMYISVDANEFISAIERCKVYNK